MTQKISLININKENVFRNYKVIFIVYTFFFFCLFFPILVQWNVIAPTRQLKEFGIIDNKKIINLIENNKFADFSEFIIPEVQQSLQEKHSGWTTLWTKQNELGRPLLGYAYRSIYFPVWVISFLTKNPWRIITALSLLFSFLSGFFMILFFREIELNSLSGLFAGICLASSPYFIYWLTSPPFLASWCWGAGALWAITRLAKHPDLLGWSALTFCVYSLLITGYPQLVIYDIYLLAGYSIYLSIKRWAVGRREFFLFILELSSAVLVGLLVAIPAYLDLFNIFTRSSRITPDISFFMAGLIKLDTFQEAIRYLTLFFTPELYGNPISPNYPFGAYDGLSFHPFYIFFIILAFCMTFRKTWGWWLAIVLAALLSFVHPLYIFGTHYLGLNISRTDPLDSVMLPLTILLGYGVDSLVLRRNHERISQGILVAITVLLIILGTGIITGLVQPVAIRWKMVLIYGSLIFLLGAQYKKPNPILLMVALAIVLLFISFPLLLRQDSSQIVKSSPLTEKMLTILPKEERFAIVSPKINILPPNFNAQLGIPSIHSYDSLSSKEYHALIKGLGGKMLVNGRWNESISPDFEGPLFWMSNIGLVLSSQKLKNTNLKLEGKVSGIYLYKVLSRMGNEIQILVPKQKENEGINITDPRTLKVFLPKKIMDKGDFLEYSVKSIPPSLLILSQTFNSDWHARVFAAQQWVRARTIKINGIFQGVLLPQNTQKIRLSYTPFVRFAWIGHIFWGLLTITLCFGFFKRKRLSRGV